MKVVDQVCKGAEKASCVREVQQKLGCLTEALTEWNVSEFGHVRKELRKLNEDLASMRDEPSRMGPSHAEIKITDCLVELHHREEIMWRQR